MKFVPSTLSIRAALRWLRNRRSGAGALSLVIHVLIGGLFLWLWTRPPPPRPQTALKVFDIAGNSGAAPAVRRARVESPLPIRVDSPLDAAPAETLGAAAGEGQVCAVGAELQAAILADPTALAELEAIPEDDRSVASAIVFWSGLPTPDVSATTPKQRPILSTVDALVLAHLELQSPECLDALQSGPTFIFLPQNDTTISAAIGGGGWRWRDLVKFLKNLQINLKPDDPAARI